MAALQSLFVSPLSGGLLLVIALYVAWTVRTWYALRRIPGPWFNAFSFVGLSATVWRGNFHLEVKKQAEKYGDLYRIGPNQVITSDIDIARRMANAKSEYSRSPWYGTFRFYPDYDHSFCLRDEEKHRDLRTRISPAYSSPIIDFETKITAQTQRLTDLIDAKYVSTDSEYRPVEFASLAHFHSMDVIGDITFGKPFGFLDEGIDIFGYLKWNDSFFKSMMTMATVPGITKVLYKPPMTWAAPKASDKVGLGRFIAAARKVVEERQLADAAGDKRKDMMGLLIKQGLETEELVSEAVLHVVAGTDSTATVMRMTLLYVICNPPVRAKLCDELDAAIAAGKISSPIKDSEARQLPYLQAVIREGIRIFPGATPPLFKTVPKGGDVIDGHALPAGTQVGVNIFGMMHSKRYWGEDADLFRPERWIEADGPRLELMSTVLEIQFGFGRYKCLGRPIVFLELNKVFPELLRRYDLAVVNAVQPVKIINAGFYLMSDMWLRITRRVDVA